MTQINDTARQAAILQDVYDVVYNANVMRLIRHDQHVLC